MISRRCFAFSRVRDSHGAAPERPWFAISGPEGWQSPARRAANLLCHCLAPEKTARICLGGAFTKATGQRALVRNAPRVIALEGCFINCALRMMQGVLPELKHEIVVADRLYEFDRNLFGSDEMPAAEIEAHAGTVAAKVAAVLC